MSKNVKKNQFLSNEVIVCTTIDLARKLNIKVVAEGVESLETAQKPKEFGCDYAQGYYLGRPMKVDHFIEYLKSKNGNIDLS